MCDILIKKEEVSQVESLDLIFSKSDDMIWGNSQVEDKKAIYTIYKHIHIYMLYIHIYSKYILGHLDDHFLTEMPKA